MLGSTALLLSLAAFAELGSAVLFGGSSAARGSDPCFNMRRDCFDDYYTAAEHCSGASGYLDCMKRVSHSRACQTRPINVKEIFDEFIGCGYGVPGHAPYAFPDFDESHDDAVQVIEEDMLYEFFLDRAVTYDQAERFCARAGGFQVLSKDEATENYVVDILKGKDFQGEIWIGLNDKAKEGDFRWEDGSKITHMSWMPQEGPALTGLFTSRKRSREDCVVMDTDAGWYDRECDETHPFVCMYRGTPSYD